MLFTLGRSPAQAPPVLNRETPPPQPLVSMVEPVPVPETFGATFIAGVGFLMLFRRRRYS